MSFTLQKSSVFAGRPGPVLVIVMDGVGLGKREIGNAVIQAKAPNLNWLFQNAPWLPLTAHGTAVGLPDDTLMGNSEVGHNAIGAGRYIKQGATVIEDLIRTGEFYKSSVLNELIDRCLARQSALHLIGLLQVANVHSHVDYLKAITRHAAARGVGKVFFHLLTDGRDDEPGSGYRLLKEFEAFIAPWNNDRQQFRVASGGGRMCITMDRYEADWEMVHRGWNTHVLGQAEVSAGSVDEAFAKIRELTAGKVDDQYTPTYVIGDANGPIGRIKDGDAVIFFNHRGDRAIEISRAFEDDNFPHFERGPRPDVLFAGMMEYDGDLHIPKRFLVAPPAIRDTLGEILAKNGIPQVAIAETQKFGHVTYFWNGNWSGTFDDRYEKYYEIKSDTGITFDLKPAMKAPEIAQLTVQQIEAGSFRFGRINFANGDMVGHTGNLAAVIQGIEAVDQGIGLILAAIAKAKGVALITADHGNSDEMIKSGKPSTAHSNNQVPCLIFDPLAQKGEYRLNRTIVNPTLRNIAATALFFLGLELRPADHFEAALVQP
jgi:2,3-bisphosphoglycerate-independent phosphoglycerate mutase